MFDKKIVACVKINLSLRTLTVKVAMINMWLMCLSPVGKVAGF